ncbi:FAD/NAD(P)-binding domain-containing protein [Sistotremastrum niveocremeum HHB9708]|uniref:FAD/NAD(P)-binding domain-containing protein n=2 Tax=Sistotremastraceae TaxID=3402574 RepID=A0A164PAS9_9AGAM|nr:FAD/NAD(P)-binding domain-containing protein [Sistotremastrum niveocremeum HHB9708]KZT32833.1 FAD/NAD(P)-binding domain-containing protein [Sistotremastrum suecicum HHB10207 ss-3]
MSGYQHLQSAASDIPDFPSEHIFAHRARYLTRRYLEDHSDVLSGLPPLKEIVEKLPNRHPHSDAAQEPVCIIGAGAAGLYTAMILDSLGIPYQLLEASDRVGGRMHTYTFPPPNRSSYEYFELGAMRFPDTPYMKRTFDLVRNRGLQNIKLIDFAFSSDNTFACYNGVNIITSGPNFSAPDPFNIKDYVPANFRSPKDVNTFLSKIAIDEPRQLFLKNNIQTALELLYKNYDSYSMRSWLMAKFQLSSSTINWLETLDKSTGWYDRGLIENVLESLAFDWPGATPGKPVAWHCFLGGTSTVPVAMHNSLKTKAQFNSRVTQINEEAGGLMSVAVNGKPLSQRFSSVICTIPLGCLSLVNLVYDSIAYFNYPQWSAIRELQYSSSIKIGIRFTEPWWEHLQSGKIVGGQSFTDLPIRTTVYPSYPPGIPKSNVLIASYCWTADAERLGALIKDGKADPLLVELVIRDLAALHNVADTYIWNRFVNDGTNIFAWDWLHNPYTCGAFALFGPGEFADSIFTQINKPAANGKLFFAGEALSSCHGWVAGALDSSWLAVNNYLTLLHPEKLQQFKKDWGESEYWDTPKQQEDVLRLGLRHHLKK